MVSSLLGLLVVAAILSGTSASALHGAVKQREPLVGATINAYSTIQAESFDPTTSAGIVVFNGGSVIYIGSIDDGDYVCYDQVDFQDGAVGFKIQLSSSLEAGITGSIDLVLDYQDNTPFHSVLVGTTHSDTTWTLVNEFLESNDQATGVHTLCLVFRDTYSTQSYVNVDWFEFFQ